MLFADQKTVHFTCELPFCEIIIVCRLTSVNVQKTLQKITAFPLICFETSFGLRKMSSNLCRLVGVFISCDKLSNESITFAHENDTCQETLINSLCALLPNWPDMCETRYLSRKSEHNVWVMYCYKSILRR